MAKFLFTWELGGGLGHLANLQPIVAGLVQRGHEVQLACCDAEKATNFLPGIVCVQSPQNPPQCQFIAEPSTFAEILYNAGCDDSQRLETLIAAWQEIFREQQPDVLVTEFSPIAFIAAQGTCMRIVQMATGHAWPPNVAPLPDLCPWRNNYPERLAMIESRVLNTISSQLVRLNQPSIHHVGELFARTHLQLLTTFSELDHYQDRVGGNYVGNWSQLKGDPPEWPQGNQPCVFVYLKSALAIKTVLGQLQRRNLATVAFVPDHERLGLPEKLGSIRITSRPVDIAEAAAECDLAIIHAGHGTTSQMLLAGKPILAIPLLGEQGIVARNILRLGAGVSVEADNPPDIVRGLNLMLNDTRYRQAAQIFRESYSEFDRAVQMTRVLDSLEKQLI